MRASIPIIIGVKHDLFFQELAREEIMEIGNCFPIAERIHIQFSFDSIKVISIESGPIFIPMRFNCLQRIMQ